MELILLPEELKKKYNGIVPYDVYFHSLQEKIDNRVCRSCGKYFALQISLKEHKLVCKKKRMVDTAGPASKRLNLLASLDLSDEFFQEEEEENLQELVEEILETSTLRSVISVPAVGGIETILNLREWLKTPKWLRYMCMTP